MPVNIVDVDAFTSPVTAPAGADVANAASVVDPVQKLANRTRNLKEIVDPDDDFPGGGTLPTRTRTIPLWFLTQFEATPTQQWKLTNSGFTRESAVNSATGWLPITGPWLPHGAVLTKVEVIADPGAARAGANRMLFRLRERTPNYVTPSVAAPATIGVDQNDDATANIQVITWGTLNIAITSGKEIVMNVTAGNDAGTNVDKIESVRVTFTDPGPRNF